MGTDNEEFAEDYEFDEGEEELGEEQIQSGGMDIGEDFDDFDADEDAMLFAEGDTEEEMSEDWLRRMVELDEKKKKKNSKELNDDKKNAEISEDSRKDKKTTL